MTRIHSSRATSRSSRATSRDLATITLALSLGLAACAHGPSEAVPRTLDEAPFSRFSPEGGPLRLSSERGNVVFLDFWATWCEPCRDALAELDQLADQYKDQPVRFYAVSVDEDPNKLVEYIKAQGLKIPVLLDQDARIAEGLLQLRRVPAAVLVDKRGGIRERHEGYSPGALINLGRQLNALIEEK